MSFATTTVARALGGDWNDVVDARRVVDAIGGPFSSLGRSSRVGATGRVLCVLPEELVLYVATDLSSLDIFCFARSCKFVASLLRSTVSRDEDGAFVAHLKRIAKLPTEALVVTSGEFVAALSQGLLLLSYLRQRHTHRFKTGHAYDAMIHAIEAQVASGGRRPRISQRSEVFEYTLSNTAVDDEVRLVCFEELQDERSQRWFKVSFRATEGAEWVTAATLDAPELWGPPGLLWKHDVAEIAGLSLCLNIRPVPPRRLPLRVWLTASLP